MKNVISVLPELIEDLMDQLVEDVLTKRSGDDLVKLMS